MSTYESTDYSRIKRVAKRGHYDETTVHEVVDSAYVAHVGFNMADRPFVIPMLHARVERTIYLHASTKSRFYKQLAEGAQACLTVTHVDGLVVARSAFHHSMNYRSAVVHGICRGVTPEEREQALAAFTNKILPGRWEECRPVQQKELDVTGVIALDITTASAKIRTGGPSDDAEDYALPIWAGVIPIEQQFGNLIPDEKMTGNYPIPESVKRVLG